jgi:hypothetical protein
MAVRLSALRAGRPLPPGRFLVLISVRGWVDPRAIVRLEGLGQLKTSSDLNGDRSRDRQTCSIVPQPTTLPRVTKNELIIIVFCSSWSPYLTSQQRVELFISYKYTGSSVGAYRWRFQALQMHTQKYGQESIRWVRFRPQLQVSERFKTARSVDHSKCFNSANVYP